MARLAYIRRDSAPAHLQGLIEQIKQERRGQVSLLFQMLLSSPPVAAGWLHLGSAIRYETELDGVVRELAICRVGQLTDAEYEWQAHAPLALREGATQAQLDELARWRESDRFSPAQRAALAFTEQVTTDLEADDATYADVRGHFSERETLELLVSVAFYDFVSRVLRTIRVDLEQ